MTGYQVLYSQNKNFKSGNKSYTLSKKTYSSLTVTNLPKGKTYYVKVRAYKIINGKKYYGTYGAAKQVKIK